MSILFKDFPTGDNVTKYDYEALNKFIETSSNYSEYLSKVEDFYKKKNESFSYSTIRNYYYKVRPVGKTKKAAKTKKEESHTEERASSSSPPPEAHEESSEPVSQAGSKEGVPVKTEPVQVLSSGQVDVKPGKVLPEQQDIKDVYKNMLKEEIKGEPTMKKEVETETPTGKVTETVTSRGAGEYAFAGNSLFSMIAKSINDNLLYGGAAIIGNRKLFLSENEMIDSASNNIPEQYTKQLEEQPWVNWAIASFLVPAVSRIDLWIDFVADTLNGGFSWAPGGKTQQQQSGQRQQNTQTRQQGPAPGTKTGKFFSPVQPQQESTMPNRPQYSEAQLAQIEMWRNSGAKIDPNYEFSGALDIMAYRDYKMIRNVGSNWSG